MRTDPHPHHSLIGGGHRRASSARTGRLRGAAKIGCLLLALAFATGWVFAQAPRGYRTIDQSSGTAVVGIGIEGELGPGQVVLERLPQDVFVVGEVHALRLIGLTAENEPIIEIVPVSLPPPIPEGEFSLQEFQFASEGVTGFSYTINRLLVPGEMITGDVAGGSNPGLIDNVWGDANNPILEQLENLQQRLFSAINIVTCTAFSVIPGGSSSSFNSECYGQSSPRTISFDDRLGAFILGDLNASRSANEGESRLSIALGTTVADACKNQVEQGFIAGTFTPAVRGLYRVGEAFTVSPNDSRNNGKKAKAEVTITGGGTGSNSFAFEGLVETFSTNPAPCPIPPQPPIVYPSGAAVSDRVEVIFGTGQGTAFSPIDTRAVNSSFTYSLTAAPCTCECSENYPDGAFTETFTTEIMDSQVFESRAFACSAAITIGSAGSAYDFTGGPKDLLGCFVLGFIAPECLDVLPDIVTNQDGKGLRFETVTVDFKHQDLAVVSVAIDDVTPLDGVIAIVSAEVENIGEADAEAVGVKLFDNNILRGVWEFPRIQPGAANRETFQMGWDTTGLFGGGPRTLRVEVISRVTAELEYGNNSGQVSGVEVQPSVKAAFISTDETVATSCNQCGEVRVYDTQTFKHIGTLDLHTQLGINRPHPKAVAVPNAGDNAWVVLGEDGSGNVRFGLLGIDVLSCYSGTCQPLGSVSPGPGASLLEAGGGVGVLAGGSFAFVPYNDNQLSPRMAVYPISLAGAGSPTSNALPSSNDKFDTRSVSSVAVAVTGNMKQQVFIAGGHKMPATDNLLRVYWIDADQAGQSPVPIERRDVALTLPKNTSTPLAVDFTALITQETGAGGQLVDVATPGSKSVYLDTRNFNALHTLLVPCPRLHPDYIEADPVAPCLEGTGNIPLTDAIVELAASRDGTVAASSFAFSFQGPDYYWLYNPDASSAPPVTSQVDGCAGTQLLCTGSYQDIAVGFPVSRQSNTPVVPEVWLVDETGAGGDAEVFAYPSGPSIGGFSTGNPNRAITIAPIPLGGTPCYFMPPIPIPIPPPTGWPSGVQANFNINTMDPLQEILEILQPILGCLGVASNLNLDFPDLPSGWQVSWNQNLLSNIPPWDGSLGSLRFLPVTFTPPPAFNGAAILTARIYPQGQSPSSFAPLYIRIERPPCAPTLFGTNPGGQDLYTIDPSTGSSSLVGNMGIEAPSVAIDPTTGMMYAGTGGGLADLYTVNPDTAETTLVGDTGFGIASLDGLDFDPAGTLYAAANAVDDGGTGGDTLAIIDKTTGVGTVVGPFGGGIGMLAGSGGIEGIAFDAAGMLYGASGAPEGGNADPILYLIDVASGDAAPVGPIVDVDGNPPAGGVVSLAFDESGALFGGTGLGTGDLILIDPASGLFEPIGHAFDGSLGGLAFTRCPCRSDAECDDRVVCNGAETCDLATGTCQSGAPPACGDGNVCTDDLCDEAAGGCINPPFADGTSCEDGLFCNGAETCLGGSCEPGIPVVCEDGNACTIDFCDEGTRMCQHDPSFPPGPVGDTLRGAHEIETGISIFQWSPAEGAESHNTYRGLIGAVPGLTVDPTVYNHVCYEPGDAAGDGPTTSTDASLPALGTAYYYDVSGENACGEGPLGSASDGTPRPNPAPCSSGQ
jgi:hypothetical protein